jgi:Periplasmic binding protein
VLRTRELLGVGVVVVALAVTGGVVPSVAQAQGGSPKATEVGITPTEIHIGIVADVDNPFVPGLFQGVVDGLRGAANYLNSQAGGGGLAGRKLVVDFYDSKLSSNEARNGVIKACQQDFAMVGNAALFLANMDDAINCKDTSGAATGLPDIPAIATGVPETCAPVTYPIGGTQLICSTKDQHPQTYNVNQGDFKYFLKLHKNNLHGALLASNDTKDATRGGAVLIGGAIQAGIKPDQNVTRSGRDQQSAFTGIVTQMKRDSSNYSLIVMSANSAIQLRSEAQLQGVTDPNIVWECVISCYDKLLPGNAAVMEGEYIPLTFLPFEEAGSNATLDNFLKYVGKNKANGFAVYGWVAGLVFAEAVKAAVAKDGVNGLTRRTLVGGIKTLHTFNAGGMVATVDVASRTPAACFMLVQFKRGTFKRVYPKKKGTFDCKPSNHIEVKADLIGN